jgi:hypothetical protein
MRGFYVPVSTTQEFDDFAGLITQLRPALVGVFCWRMARLEDAGLSGPQAVGLAVRSNIDLHEALALIRSGCPADTALRILG